MRKIAIEDLIQLLGMVGIIGSLIFVGLEMRQSQNFAEAAQQQTRSDSTMNQFAVLTEAGHDAHSILTNDLSESYGLRPLDVAARNFYHQLLTLYESDFFQYQRGLMPPSVWNAKLGALAFLKTQCNHREILDFRLRYFPKELSEIIAALPDPCAD
jgi:hypothetical protein